MSRDRDPYQNALARLRQGLRAGAFGHGQPLHVHKLASELAVSATPVREALARLAGEGLVERAPGGYLTPRHDAASVAELYALDEIYALAGLAPNRHRLATSAMSAAPPAASGHLERTELALARLGMPASRAFWSARRNLWSRLAPFRDAEVTVLGGLEEELSALEAEPAGPSTTRGVRAYYRRRVRAAAAIFSATQGRNIS